MHSVYLDLFLQENSETSPKFEYCCRQNRHQCITYFFSNDKDLFSWDLNKGGDDAVEINKVMDKGTKLLVMNISSIT